ncbi:MAG TPA: MBL fold metallo-hydrolase [Sphingobacteriaceae bacterium]|nr:MBL fold metallo-hydrolase [Sphingobacteriaceae bacterium]
MKKQDENYFKVARGVWGLKIIFVNIFMVQDKESGKWILIDGGLKGSSGRIIRMSEKLFGKGTSPEAIVLTHGHFDHRGALKELLKKWNVTIYAHSLEAPYLTGLSPYPPSDPFAGGGIMALTSALFPNKPIDLGKNFKKLRGNTVPNMPEWKIIPTPGHSPGHISLYRESDKTLIAGDAFVTTKQESAYYVITQKKKLCGPPKFYTPDWVSAKSSVEKLAALKPKSAAAGHGKPMYGRDLQNNLKDLALHFDEQAIPHSGRYVSEPAVANASGIVRLPKSTMVPKLLTAMVIMVLLTTVVIKLRQ